MVRTISPSEDEEQATTVSSDQQDRFAEQHQLTVSVLIADEP